jgi:uncharacterized membrane protein (DUF106 family)
MILGISILIIAIIVFGVLVMIGSYLEARERVRQERERVQAYVRAMEAKRELDAQAFRAAKDIQDAIRRNGGSRG